MGFLIVCDTCGRTRQSYVGESPRKEGGDELWSQKDVQLRTSDGEVYVRRYHFCSKDCENASHSPGWQPHYNAHGL
jgi:hypothetical protein